MKIFAMILLTMSMNACGGSKEIASTITDEKNTTEASKNAIKDESVLLIYTASTRGFFSEISINKTTTTYQLTRNGKITTVPTLEKDWTALMNAMEGIEHKSITTLEAPSKARHYDGAAHATFTIKENKTSLYATPQFDAGNPHETIAPVIKKMLSLLPVKK